MMIRPQGIFILSAILAVFLSVPMGSAQEDVQEDVLQEVQEIQDDVIIPQTTGIYGNFYSIIQLGTPLKRFDGSKKKIAPFYQYLELNANNPESNISFNTFLRAAEVLDGEDKTFDLYNAYFEYNHPEDKFQLRLGRQIITESTKFLLLDGAQMRFRPMNGVTLSAYGGYQDRDAQPDPEEPERSFGAYGAAIKFDNLLGSIVSLGYEAFDPEDFGARHFLNLSFNRVLPFSDSADIYSRVEFDLEEGNLALFTVGIGLSPIRSIYFNFEYGTYKPDDDDDEFLMDPIFDLFSISRMHEGRFGLTYYVNDRLEITSTYSLAHYDVQDDVDTWGHIIKFGFAWDFYKDYGLRAYQGVYIIDGRDDDRALGLNLALSQELRRGWNVDLAFAYANFDKLTNKDGNAFSYIVGTTYMLTRGLQLKAELEVNSNPDFEHDVRGNLGLSYYF